MKRMLFACALTLAACGPKPNYSATGLVMESPTHTLTPASLPAFFSCLQEKSQTIIEAHRGGNEPGYAENAVEAFAHTLSQEPAIMEIDVGKTKDGAFVLMHDDGVDRTTNGHGLVPDLTLAQIQTLTLKDDNGRPVPGHPPTRQVALDWANGKTILALDIKPSVKYQEVEVPGSD